MSLNESTTLVTTNYNQIKIKNKTFLHYYWLKLYTRTYKLKIYCIGIIYQNFSVWRRVIAVISVQEIQDNPK